MFLFDKNEAIEILNEFSLTNLIKKTRISPYTQVGIRLCVSITILRNFMCFGGFLTRIGPERLGFWLLRNRNEDYLIKKDG